jgi:hypothetical protein
MNEAAITFRTIGVIHSEHVAAKKTPIGLVILDNTPLLDIKPYTAKFDCFETTRNGWQEVDGEIARQRGRRDYKGGAVL